jgi:hypothetical protein
MSQSSISTPELPQQGAPSKPDAGGSASIQSPEWRMNGPSANFANLIALDEPEAKKKSS